ncbi:MAG: hypothetical protein ABIH48_01975 [Candidatus Falkowbacteria bacterium]
MDIIINLDKVVALFSMPADVLLAKFFLYVGWLPLAGIILWGILQIWLNYIIGDYVSKWEFVLLAIDVPPGNEQTPKAIEQLFAHLAGAHTSVNLVDKYWVGKKQHVFSFEIISIGGYTQFIIRTNKATRNLVEAMIYAQYPDAEITEVEDYVSKVPDRFPDDNYDIMGAEWVPAQNEMYPIKLYTEFEDKNTGDFKDPMAALMEMYGGLRKGEQCWYQIIIVPTNFEWEKRGPEEISKIIGEKVEGKKNMADKIIDPLISAISSISDFLIPLGDVSDKKENELDTFKMFNLKPAEKKRMDAVQLKVSKIGFECKIRFIYVAEKEVMDRNRFSSFVGVMKQYSAEDVNSLKPDMETTATSTSYIMKASRLNERKNRLMAGYKARSDWLGKDRYILNIEELATLWHFPLEEAVKAPMLQKVASRKGAAPSYLPVEGTTSDFGNELKLFSQSPKQSSDSERDEIFAPAKSATSLNNRGAIKKSGPPANLPV